MSDSWMPSQGGVDDFGDVWGWVETTPWWRRVLNFVAPEIFGVSRSHRMLPIYLNPTPPEFPPNRAVLYVPREGLPRFVNVAEYLELRRRS